MTREEELKKELEQIEINKKQVEIDRQLESMTLVGKCFASHNMNRYLTKKPSYQFGLVHITGKRYDKDAYVKYLYTGYRIEVQKDGDSITIKSGEIGFEQNFLIYKYEITEEQFNHVKNEFIPSIEVNIDKIRNSFHAQQFISQGDFQNDSRGGDRLTKLGLDFIDLSNDKNKLYGSNITIYELLQWNNHPYLFNCKLYKSFGWLEIVENIRNEIRSNAISWGGSIYERDAPRIKMLDEFILKYK